MFLSRRVATSRLISSTSKPHQSQTPWRWYRRQYAAVGDLPIRRVSPNSVDSNTRPQFFKRKILSSEDREKLMSHLSSDSNGVWFGSSSDVNHIFYEHLAIRDMCQCSKCVDGSTKQRLFSFADIPSNIQGEYQRSGDNVTVRWTNDVPGFDKDHLSTFPVIDLYHKRSRVARASDHRNIFKRTLWNKSSLQAARPQLELKYDDFLHDPEFLSRAVRQLLCWGLIFINEVPSETTSVETLVRRLGPIRNTFYGETWDVRSVAGAKNVAYTARDLGFHQDLLYMANPPGLQALHMIKASSTGGESLFTDGARAVDDMLLSAPEYRSSLVNFLVTYRYQNAGEWYEYTRPTLEGHGLGAAVPSRSGSQPRLRYGESYEYINWSPPFQGPFADDRGKEKRPREGEMISRLAQYRNAAEALRQRFEAPEAVYETRMEPGTCVIFNNRRILHARKAFPVDGEGAMEERWLRGAYADLDPLMSRYRTAERPHYPKAANKERTAQIRRGDPMQPEGSLTSVETAE